MDERVETKQQGVPAKGDIPAHIVEKPDMKGTYADFPYKVDGPTVDGLMVASKSFMIGIVGAKGQTRYRDYFDPRYLKKHGLTDRDITFEIGDHHSIHNITVADDMQTVLCTVELNGGKKEVMILRWVVYEGHLYISPEKAPDPKTGIFKPWILRKRLP